MNLQFQRQQERTAFGSREYILHALLICSGEQLHLIKDHRLDRKILFAIPEKEHFRQRAEAAFDRADNRSVFSHKDAGKMFTDQLAGLVHAARAGCAFAVTVADAINGVSIRCPDLLEVLDCERQIAAAFDELYRDLENAYAFSVSREQILVPDGIDEPPGPPPADWGNRRPRRRPH